MNTLANQVEFSDQQYRNGTALVSDAEFNQLENNLV
tara:strand:- start:413 stop:520 length:108 start_codon:yes stop_codon:yes gene_type:complete